MSLSTNKKDVLGKESKKFNSSIGLLLSCLGAAVGTGNIWRYPRVVANNTGEKGSLGFVLIWCLCLFTWSIPLVIIEYGLGRYTKCGPIMSFKKLLGPNRMWCGAFIGVTNFAMSAYYSVICGWCLYYFGYFVFYPLPLELSDSQAVFDHFIHETLFPVLFEVIIIIMGGLSVLTGVQSIEVVMTVLVPVFLLILFISFSYALTLPFASIGISHLFSMDWTVMTQPGVWIEALTQNAWDTGAGLGILFVLANYFGKEHGVVKYGVIIPSINNLISLLMAITIFSTVFSIQVTKNPTLTVVNIVNSFKDNGPANTGLTFIWLPIFYSTLSFGRLVTVVFFFCLFLGSFSSFIGMLEAACHQLVDLNIPRKTAVVVVCFLMALLGLGSALNVHFMINQDFVWGSAVILSGSMLVYLVISIKPSKFRDQIVNKYGDGSDWKLPFFFRWIVWILIPIQVVFVFVWWIVNNLKEYCWYEIKAESMMSVILQWFSVFLILILLNYLYVKCIHGNPSPQKDAELEGPFTSEKHRNRRHIHESALDESFLQENLTDFSP